MPSATLAGNEITDAVRTAATSGDGLASPQSMVGIYEAVTNRIANPSAESDAASWTAISGTTVTRVTTQFKFGVASIQVVTPNAAAAEGVRADSATGLALAAATNCAGLVWVRGASGTVNVRIRITNTDASTTDGANTLVTLTTAWQLVTPASVAVAGGKTGDQLSIIVETDVQQGITYHCDGAQVRSGATYPTPFYPGSRAAGRIQFPRSLLQGQQGWIALGLRLPWAAAAAHGASPWGWNWQTDVNNLLRGWYFPGGSAWVMASVLGGTVKNVIGAAQGFAAGASLVVVWKWAGTSGGVLASGASSFTTGTIDSLVPADALFDVGRDATGTFFLNGDVRWMACGIGPVSDADGVTLLGLNDPLAGEIPSTCRVTGIWHASTAEYLYAVTPAALIACDCAGESLTGTQRRVLNESAKLGRARQYDVADTVRLDGEFSVGGAAVDPGTVTVKVQTPAGVTTSYTYAAAQVTRAAQGRYHYDLALTAAGYWYVRIEGTDPATAAEEWWLYVRAQQVT